MILIGVIGLLVFIVGVVWLIISAFKKKGKRKPLLTIIIGLIVFIVGVANTPPTEEAVKSSSESTTSKTSESSQEDISDITVLSDEATSNQKDILLGLAQQKFDQEYPYKGSKIHAILGVMQDWTQNSGQWYYKASATIVNEFGAEQDVNLEVHITPESPTTGSVELVAY